MTAAWWREGVGAAPRGVSGPFATRRVDVVVVGAGIAGLSAALFLERRGATVALVDAEGVGGGASGRNAGFLMRGAADCYAVACRQWGRDRARWVWRLTEDNLTMLRGEGIEALPSVRAVPSALLALDEDELGLLRESEALMAEDGFASAWESSGDDAVWRAGLALGALVNPADMACNPLELLYFLHGKLRGETFAPQRVRSLTESAGAVTVHTEGGTLEAAHALLCTNAYLARVAPEASAWATPRRGQMLALRGEGLRLDRSYYANRGSEYFRQGVDGVVVLGGFRTRFADAEVGYEDAVTEGVQGALEALGRRLFGDGPKVVARWSGVMGFGPGGLPRVGPLPGHARVWGVAGFTGHGMSMAHRVAGMAVAAMLDGADNPFAGP